MSNYPKMSKLGKTVAGRQYLHTTLASQVEPVQQELIQQAERLAKVMAGEDYNVVRIDGRLRQIGLLAYDDFFDDPFPNLKKSWLIDLETNDVRRRTYEASLNPPILHRKELLLPADHPRQDEYKLLSVMAEEIGLFDNPTRIGYRMQWRRLIKEKGYEVVGHQLVPVGNNVSDDQAEDDEISTDYIARHRTALVRYTFSAPIQSLSRYGFLNGTRSVFDYGCGRGDDIRGLIENGVDAAGWDPYFAPENAIVPSDVVNLGFVINVIEDFDERVEALTRAYSLASELLTISVMLANDNRVSGRQLHDGIITKRGTFQKYYTQGEFKSFVESVLDEEPIAVAPGVLYVFRDKGSEQRFLSNRYRSRPRPLPRFFEKGSKGAKVRRSRRVIEIYESNKTILDSLWDRTLELGREPDDTELENPQVYIDAFGSVRKAVQFVKKIKDEDLLAAARADRIRDVEVYLALREFEQKKAYKHLEPRLKRDIKSFFGTISEGRTIARELLFGIADIDLVTAACREAAERGFGYILENNALQIHSSLVNRLPTKLRIVIGCAAVLYGDYQNADLIKIHPNSGKVSLMTYDDFEDSPTPRLLERIKIKLRDQDIEYFDYTDRVCEPPILFMKSRYINEEYPIYPEQKAFDEQLNDLALFDLTGYGPSVMEFERELEVHRWQINGYELIRSQGIPDIDTACGRYFKYRDLIECGETQVRIGMSNRPAVPDSYTALHDLAVNILDPVIEYFGMIRLTYGFCSSELAKYISHGIAPKLDQHAAHEKTRTGRHICMRLGAAADFIVEYEDMWSVVLWIVNNTPFDRLYFYGNDVPIHVSYGPDMSKVVYSVSAGKKGVLTPRRVDEERLRDVAVPKR